MAKISTVDYKGIPSKVSSMRSSATELNKAVTDAYNSMGPVMVKYWYGKRYNELVKSFNGLTQSINSMLDLVVKEIPFALETVANNYSKADTGSTVTSATQTAPTKVTNISESTQVGMKYMSANVASIRENIMSNFRTILSDMNTIEQTYQSITWESEAASAFKAKFTKLKKDIVDSFQRIKDDFNKYMQAAEQDINSAEKANTVQ